MKSLSYPVLLAAGTLSTAVLAEVELPQVYGRADLSVQAHDTASAGSVIQESSNASRLGFHNTHALNDALEVFYRLEYQVNFDESKKAGAGEDVFKARNSIVGLAGSYGTVFLGIHDTPLKKAQGKVDLFSDYFLGDIKKVMNGENRESNSLSYQTPKLAGLQGWVMLLQGEGSDITGDGQADDSLGDALSASVSYAQGPIKAAVAYDSKVNETDTLRASAQYSAGAFSLGALVNQSEPSTGGADSELGYLLSASVKLTAAHKLKAQFVASDEKGAGGQMVSLGWDYTLAKSTRLYAYYTDLGFDDAAKDESALGLGIRHEFGKSK